MIAARPEHAERESDSRDSRSCERRLRNGPGTVERNRRLRRALRRAAAGRALCCSLSADGRPGRTRSSSTTPATQPNATNASTGATMLAAPGGRQGGVGRHHPTPRRRLRPHARSDIDIASRSQSRATRPPTPRSTARRTPATAPRGPTGSSGPTQANGHDRGPHLDRRRRRSRTRPARTAVHTLDANGGGALFNNGGSLTSTTSRSRTTGPPSAARSTSGNSGDAEHDRRLVHGRRAAASEARCSPTVAP